MANEDLSESEGVIIEARISARRAKARISARGAKARTSARRNKARAIAAGDRVAFQIFPIDHAKGRPVYRHNDAPALS